MCYHAVSSCEYFAAKTRTFTQRACVGFPSTKAKCATTLYRLVNKMLLRHALLRSVRVWARSGERLVWQLTTPHCVSS
jgi:hypothetical protein